MEVIRHKYQVPNVGKAERAASIAAGTFLVARGVLQRGWAGTAKALVGAAFLHRGVTGNCHSYQALGVNTAHPHHGTSDTASDTARVLHGTGIRIDEAITINRPREEVYRFWRDLGNVAEFMEYVESVRTVGPDGDGLRTRWTAKSPTGKSLEWEAQIINEKENELIAWRSLAGSEVANAGSVHFKDAGGRRGTEIHLEILYAPPGGSLGALTGAIAARLFGADPAAQIRSDLKRLKARLEAGVLPDTDGQSAGAGNADVRDADASSGRRLGDQIAKASEESFPASDSPAFTH